MEKTIVAFHVGRGGHFYNSSNLSFCGEYNIGHFTDDLMPGYEKEYEIAKQIGNRPNLRQLFDAACNEESEQAIKRLSRLGLHLGDEIYRTSTGHPVELTRKDVETGIGRIDIDGDYNTTYTTYLENCSKKELLAMIEKRSYEGELYAQKFFDDHTGKIS